jgi:hypothetical protein
MTLLAEIRALIAEHAEPPAADDAELQLPSLVLVIVAEELERRHGFLVAARELTPEYFGSIARLAAFVERKRGAR